MNVDLTDVNKLTRSLDFFQEPIRDLNLDPRSSPDVIDEAQKNKINDVAKMAEFLDRMGTLDIVETSVFYLAKKLWIMCHVDIEE